MDWRIDMSLQLCGLVKNFDYEEESGGNASYKLTMSEEIFNEVIRGIHLMNATKEKGASLIQTLLVESIFRRYIERFGGENPEATFDSWEIKGVSLTEIMSVPSIGRAGDHNSITIHPLIMALLRKFIYSDVVGQLSAEEYIMKTLSSNNDLSEGERVLLASAVLTRDTALDSVSLDYSGMFIQEIGEDTIAQAVNVVLASPWARNYIAAHPDLFAAHSDSILVGIASAMSTGSDDASLSIVATALQEYLANPQLTEVAEALEQDDVPGTSSQATDTFDEKTYAVESEIEEQIKVWKEMGMDDDYIIQTISSMLSSDSKKAQVIHQLMQAVDYCAAIPTTSAMLATDIPDENNEIPQAVENSSGIIRRVVDWLTSLRARGSDNLAEAEFAAELLVQTRVVNTTASEENAREVQLESSDMPTELVITIPPQTSDTTDI
jgi:hypothetical protein